MDLAPAQAPAQDQDQARAHEALACDSLLMLGHCVARRHPTTMEFHHHLVRMGRKASDTPCRSS